MSAVKDSSAVDDFLPGTVYSISEPVVVAEIEGPSIYEICKVGSEELIGEVIRIEGNRTTIQVYEEIAGVALGDLSIADKTRSVYTPRGNALPALDREKKWEFTPNMKEGDYISGGDVWGKFVENSLLNEYRILMPLRARGIIKKIAKKGECTIAGPLLTADFNGEEKKYMMMQTWPVRVPRPVNERLTANSPLIAG